MSAYRTRIAILTLTFRVPWALIAPQQTLTDRRPDYIPGAGSGGSEGGMSGGPGEGGSPIGTGGCGSGGMGGPGPGEGGIPGGSGTGVEFNHVECIIIISAKGTSCPMLQLAMSGGSNRHKIWTRIDVFKNFSDGKFAYGPDDCNLRPMAELSVVPTSARATVLPESNRALKSNELHTDIGIQLARI